MTLRNHLLPWFGQIPLSSITELQVRSFVSHLVERGLAPSYVTKHLRILSQILKAAVRNHLIPRNPCDGVEGPGEAAQEGTAFLTAEELNALADAVDTCFRPMVLLAGYRGLRFGEAAGLRPRRLNLLLGRMEVGEVATCTSDSPSTVASERSSCRHSLSRRSVSTSRRSRRPTTSYSPTLGAPFSAGPTSTAVSGLQRWAGPASTLV